MTRGGQIFSRQEMSVALKKIKLNKAADQWRGWKTYIMMGDCCIGEVEEYNYT